MAQRYTILPLPTGKFIVCHSDHHDAALPCMVGGAPLAVHRSNVDTLACPIGSFTWKGKDYRANICTSHRAALELVSAITAPGYRV